MKRRRYIAGLHGDEVAQCGAQCPAKARAIIGDLTATEFLYTSVPGCTGIYSLDACYEKLNGECAMQCMGIREDFEKEQARKTECANALGACRAGCANSEQRSMCEGACSSGYYECMAGSRTAQSLSTLFSDPSVGTAVVKTGTSKGADRTPSSTTATATTTTTGTRTGGNGVVPGVDTITPGSLPVAQGSERPAFGVDAKWLVLGAGAAVLVGLYLWKTHR